MREQSSPTGRIPEGVNMASTDIFLVYSDLVLMGGAEEHLEQHASTVHTTPTVILGHLDAQSLVLFTCYPFHYIGPAPDRYLVWARPIGTESSLL